MSSSADFFGNKSKNYRNSAITQIEIVNELARILKELSIEPTGWWLDIGSGPVISQESVFSNRTVQPIYFDLSEKSLATSELLENESALCGDMDFLPLRNNTMNGVIATSSFQWSKSLDALLCSLDRIIVPGGIFAFAIFTEKTLTELRTTQKEFSLTSPVQFYRESDIIEKIRSCNFNLLHSSSISRKEEFSSGIEALRAISTIGASFHQNKQLPPSELKRFIRRYESHFTGKTIFNRYDVSFFIGTTGTK